MHNSGQPIDPSASGADEALGRGQYGEELDVAAATVDDKAQIQFEAIFEHHPNSVAFADPQRRLIRVNQKFTELYGYTEEECLGRTTEFLYASPEDYGRTGRQHYNVDAPIQPDAFVIEYRRKDASTFLGETVAVQLRDDDDQVIGYVGVTRDLTEQLEFEADRRQLTEAKSEFVATVSHELRAPLTSLLGTLDMVERHDAELPDELHKLIDMALRNGRRLGALINDILDVEKLERGQLTIELDVFVLSDVVEDVVLANRSFAAQHDVELHLHRDADDSQVCLDPGRLEQILTNLISNAIRFSPAGGAVDVDVQKRGRSSVRVQVRDRGPGIPEAFHDQVFQRFGQVQSSFLPRTSGTGLGLSIAQGLTEQMGGRIGFETEEGQGTTMFVEFPVE